MDSSVFKEKKTFFQVSKGVLLAICFSLAGILLFALTLRFFDLSDLGIKIINQIIKTISIFVGVFVCLKNSGKKGLIKGVIVAFLYTIFSFLLFSILNSNFEFNLSFVYDLFFSVFVGAICGIISVNLLKN